ncbi:MAG: pseudouridine-5-phosphate glycosidase [Chloroflexi bacterium HGW-Chloroflexi-6]|nr:MAG: pseudouridine-5-phosphate glycosidase [Chloroflexi bacterium HGW-Chloroflexi-6]
MQKLPPYYHLADEVLRARQLGTPLTALESTVITHGLPQPENLALARDMESAIRQQGATPATIAILDDKIHIGLTGAELERLSTARDVLKISLRDFATALVQHKLGGTTVAGTMFAAHQAGIQVFATGGIGGVHRESRLDISTDLKALAEIPLIVVCAGAKSILDLPATLEYLETMGVPVIGYGTDTFPEFFSPPGKLPVSLRLDSPAEIVRFAETHWVLGMKSAVLVCQPVPAEEALSLEDAIPAEEQASREAQEQGIGGQKLTPFLLGRVKELTGGKSMQANLALLKNNAVLAAKIAVEMGKTKQNLS